MSFIAETYFQSKKELQSVAKYCHMEHTWTNVLTGDILRGRLKKRGKKVALKKTQHFHIHYALFHSAEQTMTAKWLWVRCEVFFGNICLTTGTALVHTIKHGSGAQELSWHRSVEAASCSIMHRLANWQNVLPDADVWLWLSTSWVCHHHSSPMTPYRQFT